MCPLRPHCRAVVPVLVLPFLLGCTEETSVNGTVTYAGKPVPEGFITFYPVDRHGSNCGSEIRDGRYTVRAVAPGKKCVRIVTRPRPELIENERTGERSFRLLCPQLFVPSGAAGNDQLVEITPGSQTLDFALQPPGRR